MAQDIYPAGTCPGPRVRRPSREERPRGARIFRVPTLRGPLAIRRQGGSACWMTLWLWASSSRSWWSLPRSSGRWSSCGKCWA